MPADIPQTWYILQANAQQSSTVVQGPFQDQPTAAATCQSIANANPGVPYIVVKTVAGFATDTPKAVKLNFIVNPGDPIAG